jgi:uncharacterized protein (TIGR02001 family)
LKRIILTLLITISLFVPVAFAQEESNSDENAVSVSAECSFLNKYIWRGITYTDGLAVQPAITQEIGPWSIQVWGNFVGSDKNDVKDSEIDLYLNYNLEFGKLSVTPSVFYYNYPGADSSKSTAELSLALSYPLGSFTIGSSFSTDIKEAPGYLFATHDISYEKEFFGKAVLNISAGIGWGTKKFFDYYLDVSKNSLSYYHAGLTLTYSINDQLSIKPTAEIYINADKAFEELVGSNTVNYGVNFSYSF